MAKTISLPHRMAGHSLVHISGVLVFWGFLQALIASADGQGVATGNAGVVGSGTVTSDIQGSGVDLNPFAGCLGNVRCKRDTCLDACPGAPAGAVCFLNTCTGQSINGVPVEPCAAAWVDPKAPKKVVVCGQASFESAISCPANAAVVKCLADPCRVASSDCPASANPDAVCEPVSCFNATLPDGSSVPPCTAVWHLPNGILATCGAAGPREPESCACPMVYFPVCAASNRTYGNLCVAKCAKDPWVHDGPCSEGATEPGCVCAELFDPVCGVDGVTYSSTCKANCAGVKVAKPGACPSDPKGDDCFCAEIYAPVCGADGNTYSNACQAECAGVKDTKPGACTDSSNGNGCSCAEVYDPVCGADGKTYSNACQAECAGVKVAQPGACSGASGEGCSCAEIYDPVCGADGRTYSNMCEAECMGVKVATIGPCVEDVTIGCPSNAAVQCFADPCSVSSCPADPTATCLASYCSNGTYRGRPVGPCEALFVDKAGNEVDCKATDGGNNEGIICTADPGVQCFADPCSVSSCPADPSATCLASYCSNGTYRGRPVGPCEAIYVDKAGNDVDCKVTDPNTPGVITDINSCPASSPRVMCAANLVNPCANATCPANPAATCISKICAATYRGRVLQPCTAIWFNSSSGDLINCTASGSSGGNGTKPSCASCSLVYKPVCAGDKKTYPNKCVAECLGKKVSKTGKCTHCVDNECLVGQRNDLCTLGSTKQCWTKKYECRLPPSGKPGDFLGKCLPKSSGSHRRHLMGEQ